MRVAVVGPTYPYRGGISHYTTLLCRAIQAKHEVLLVSFTRQYPGVLFPGRTDKDQSRKPLTAEGVEYLIDSLNPWTWRKAALAIQDFRATKVVLQWWVAFWFPQMFAILSLLRQRGGTEIRIICHNVVEHESNWLKRTLTKRLLQRADVLITHSEAERSRLRALVGDSVETLAGFLPTFVVPSEDACDRNAAKRALGLSGGVVLFFGFIRDYKGLGVLLDAMPAVLKERDATLLVVGEFWGDKRRYLDRIKALGIGARVVLVDRYVPNEEVGRYFCAADLVVQPYLSATGSAVTQMAYGYDRPVIASRVGNVPEIIVDGHNGFVVEPGGVEGLAKAIVTALEPEVLLKLQRNAPATKLRFSWERMAAIVVGESPPSP